MKPHNPLRAVFDTNILLSAILFGGKPRVCLELVRSGTVQLFISNAILLELSRVLQQRFGWSIGDVTDVVVGLGMISTRVAPKARLTAITTDESDNRILECAVFGKVDYIVSGDTRHILPLGGFRGIRIISPAEFLRMRVPTST